MATPKEITAFKKVILMYYKHHKRMFVWRETVDPYHILVSEIMLQQTQVARVVEKYPVFLKEFPTLKSLAKPPLSSVLYAWQGMGYNRRALFLHRMAKEVVKNHKGNIPTTYKGLLLLPGVGQSTAGAVMAYAYNKPVVYIETNIRRVFIHFFFKNKNNVSDAEILLLVEKTLPQKNAREWYSALMDYGTKLAQDSKLLNPNRKSKHYTKQSTFEGSKRQVRGTILRLLTEKGRVTQNTFSKVAKKDKEYITTILNDLTQEGFVKKEGREYVLG